MLVPVRLSLLVAAEWMELVQELYWKQSVAGHFVDLLIAVKLSLAQRQELIKLELLPRGQMAGQSFAELRNTDLESYAALAEPEEPVASGKLG